MDDLVEQLTAVTTGTPDTDTRAQLQLFLAGHPVARADDDYVRFLQRYAGAYVEDATRIVDVFGFGGPATDLVDPEYPIVTPDGYLVFAQCLHNVIEDGRLTDSWQHDFAFGPSGGVYLASSTLKTQSQTFEFYADDFGQWMRKLVETDGTFERPALP